MMKSHDDEWGLGSGHRLTRKLLNRKWIGVGLLVSIIIATLGFLSTMFPKEAVQETVISAAGFSLGAGVILGFLASILKYLKPLSVSSLGVASEIGRYVDLKIDKALDSYLEQVQPTIHLTPQERSEMLEALRNKIESDSADKIYEEFTRRLLANRSTDVIERRFNLARERLVNEIQDLAKRGNLNLALGMVTTVLGLAFLAVTVFAIPKNATIIELSTYFVPRVSLVLLIEVFAYFFLNLYKQSLGEIKYFQNEVTNVESRQIAVDLSLHFDDSDSRNKVIERLSATERNFVLDKDQSTVDLERERISRDNLSSVLEALKGMNKK